jgi:hypothetical protein
MAASGPEEAAHNHARALIAGDFGTAVRGMTPEALAKAMSVGNTTWTVTAYELTSHGRDGDDHVFAINYQTDLGPLSLRYRFRDVGGEWKVVDIERTA